MELSKLGNNTSGALKYDIKKEKTYLSDNNKTVLIIDDELVSIEICEMMLKRLGYKVFKAKNGSEALDIFEDNKHQIDLVISDMNMPEMNGQELIVNLRKIDCQVKVLLSSGALSDFDENEAINKGFNGFIRKPYSMKTLSEKMAEMLN